MTSQTKQLQEFNLVGNPTLTRLGRSPGVGLRANTRRLLLSNLVSLPYHDRFQFTSISIKSRPVQKLQLSDTVQVLFTYMRLLYLMVK